MYVCLVCAWWRAGGGCGFQRAVVPYISTDVVYIRTSAEEGACYICSRQVSCVSCLKCSIGCVSGAGTRKGRRAAGGLTASARGRTSQVLQLRGQGRRHPPARPPRRLWLPIAHTRTPKAFLVPQPLSSTPPAPESVAACGFRLSRSRPRGNGQSAFEEAHDRVFRGADVKDCRFQYKSNFRICLHLLWRYGGKIPC